jgi:hypothetical protein
MLGSKHTLCGRHRELHVCAPGIARPVPVEYSMRIYLLATAAVMLAVPPAAKSHTHLSPDGTTVSWYPNECCHNRDCRPVASIKPASNGLWMTTTDGRTVLIGPNQSRRPSQDMRWHVCIGRDDVDPADTEAIVCVFEPPHS